ncbi:MAG: chitobiase/beta-hexosaminidase C-terminal domain-containing protein, partial [Opitutaceae bacterium]
MDHRWLKLVSLACAIGTGVSTLGAAAVPGVAKAAAPSASLIEAAPVRGFYEAPVTVRLDAPEAAGAQIRFTIDGTEPTASWGQPYTAPFRIEHSTILRAAVFENSRQISKVATHTYLFLADVIQQAQEQPGLPSGSRAWNGFPSAYAMDARVARSPVYGPRMKAALQ